MQLARYLYEKWFYFVTLPPGVHFFYMTLTTDLPDNLTFGNNELPGKQNHPENEPTASSSGPLPWVLVVEDNRLNSELIKIYLKPFCDMDFARTGESAVEMARDKKYDAIIMDINLGPGMDGIQATREIRTFNGYQSIPIVAVTGYTMDSDKEQILEGGCTHYVPKPLEKNSFISLMQNILLRP
jgi:CheY-like chemotaxis protein